MEEKSLRSKLVQIISGSMEGISVGEAKRRQKLDPSYGQTKIVRNACQYIDAMLREQKKRGWTQRKLFCMFTNQDRGCTKQELELLGKEIPKRYQGREVDFWALPEKYVDLPTEEALNHYVPIVIERVER